MTIHLTCNIHTMSVGSRLLTADRIDPSPDAPFRALVAFSLNGQAHQATGAGWTELDALDQAIREAACGLVGLEQALRKHPVWLRTKVASERGAPKPL